MVTNHDGQDSEWALLSCFGVSWVGYFKVADGACRNPLAFLALEALYLVAAHVPIFC